MKKLPKARVSLHIFQACISFGKVIIMLAGKLKGKK
jgi:hypothetical protein